MGREVRRVPANWEHPKDENGQYIPLLGETWSECHAEWFAERNQWQKGFRSEWVIDGPNKWVPKEDYHDNVSYTEYAGEVPNPDYYMPEWTEEERTHLMMYENTSEGTPISPAFETPEELARWLSDNNASSFGSCTATYDQWLATCKAGRAISAIIENGVVTSGVEYMSKKVVDEAN